MDFWQIILTPFSWLLKVFCQFTDSYGLALILFTIIVKIILFPLSLKGKKSMIKMNMANGELQKIKERCGNDRERYNQEVQKYYTDNNISPMGGCGWSMIPLFILMPLYSIIRRPMKHMMRLTEAGTSAVAKALGWVGEFSLTAGGAGGRSAAYNELTLSAMINAENLATAKNAVTAAGLSAASVFVINFNFLGINLADIPTFKFWQNDITWNAVGLFLLPIISAVLSLVSMIVSQKTSQMNRGDDSAAKNPSNKTMMLISPLISLWIGYTMPAGLCVYWIANSVLMMVQEWVCGMMLRKDYAEARRVMEEQAKKAKEEEKERRRQAAERKYAAQEANKGKKGQPKAKPQTEKKVDNSASREGLRSNARGRAYDPNRYPTFQYHDPNSKQEQPAPEEEPLTEEELQLLAENGVDVSNITVEEPAVEETEAVEEGYEEAYAPESEDEA